MRLGRPLLRVLAVSLLAPLLWLTALLCGLLLYGRSAPFLITYSAVLQHTLNQQLKGQFSVGPFTEVSLGGIALSSFAARTESGEDVVVAERIRVDQPLPYALYSLLQSNRISIDHLSIAKGALHLVPGTDESLALTEVFAARQRNESDIEGSGIPLQFQLQRFSLERINVNWQPEGDTTPRPNVHVSRILGGISATDNHVQLKLDTYAINWAPIPGLAIEGAGSASLSLPGELSTQWQGHISGISTHVQAFWDGDKTASLRLESNELEPTTLRRLIPSWEGDASWQLSSEIGGTWPDIDIEASARSTEGELSASGRARLVESGQIELEARAQQLELATLHESIPGMRIDAGAKLKLGWERWDHAMAQGSLTGRVSLPPIAGEPATDIDIDLRLAPEHQLSGTANTLARGSPLEVEWRPVGQGRHRIRARLSALPLSRILKQPGLAGSLQAKLDADVDDTGIHGELTGTLKAVSWQQARLAQAEWHLGLERRWDRLKDAQWSARARIQGLQGGAVGYEHGRVEFEGNPEQGRFKILLSDPDGRTVQAAGNILTSTGLRDVSLDVSRRGVRAQLQVSRLDWDLEEIYLPQFSVTGAGEALEGSMRWRPQLLEVNASSGGIQLARLMEALGLEPNLAAGTLALRAELQVGRDLKRGSLWAEGTSLSLQHWGRVDAHLAGELRDNQVSLELWGTDETTGIGLGMNTQATLAGEASLWPSWRDAWGRAEFAARNLQLNILAKLLGEEWDASPLEDVRGTVGARLRVERTEGRPWPSGIIEVGAQDLGATWPSSDGSDDAKRLDGYSLYLSTIVDSESRALHGGGSVSDRQGKWATFSAATQMPAWSTWLSEDALSEAWLKETLRLAVDLAPRQFAELPLPATSQLPTGAFSGHVEVVGNAREPEVNFTAKAAGIRDSSGVGLALDLLAHGTAQPGSGSMQGEVQAHSEGGQRIAQGNFQIRRTGSQSTNNDDANAKSSPDKSTAPSLAWLSQHLVAQLQLHRAPLRLIPGLDKLDATGGISGEITLDTLARRPLEIALEAHDLRLRKTLIGSGPIRATLSDRTWKGNIELKGPEHQLHVFATAQGNKDSAWPNPLDVSAVRFNVGANQFPASAYAPWIEDVALRVEGTSTVRLSGQLEKGNDGSWRQELRGEATADLPRVYLRPLGLELLDLRTKLLVVPQRGKTRIVIDQFSARARAERDNLQAQGSITVSGTRLDSGSAAVVLRSVPISVEGLNLGRTTGRAGITLSREKGWSGRGGTADSEYLLVDVELNDWQTLASRSVSRSLLDTAENPEVFIRQAPSDTSMAPAPKHPYRVRIRLKRDVRLKFEDLDLPLAGQFVVDQAPHPQLRGEIVLHPGGRLPVFGYQFQVLEGKLTLNPRDNSNPFLDIALEGTTADSKEPVSLHVTGTLKDPVMTPPASELQELLGGAQAAALGGGVQALGINRLLGESVEGVELRVGSGEAADAPRYSAAVKLDENLWFEGAYERSEDTSAVGSGNVFSGSLDYRFRESWSLRTELGNRGGSVGLQWQHRY